MSASDIYENAPLGKLINYGDRAPKPLARQDRLMNALPARAAGIPAGFLDQTASNRTSRATRILHAADHITPFLERGRPIGANARERALQRPARQNGIPGELVEASLNRYLVPALGSRSIHHVTDTDIANITNKIVAGGHPQAANTAFWYMRAFSTGVANRRNGSSRFPREELENPAPIVKRKRVVNDAELAAIWTGCEPEPGDIGYSFGSIVKLLMLTGQRRTEVAAMRWSELNLEAGTWELSGDRTKNEEPTLIPLSTLAVSVPQSVPKTNDTFVFPARGNGKSHFSGYAKGKKALDGKVNIDGVALENWTLHDLRRTLATNLGRRQVLPHVIEHILNYKAASLTDIGEIYNLYTYVKEKREVLQMWSNHIEWMIKQAAEMDALAA
ncbi:hypothetical protein EJ070_00705 [Mesorhizobium sp. M1E.F.Ca.ET.045.02.1.1]|uniref:site-specific integrase n=2 Tax=unclassified Mesorhizobium TaxID=325217 RepID=UPI000F75B74A|nr:site-specific integrase [Mesorhizobium sp. M1E.F.Ca.ET.045.02.1.1]AZO19422.1 hypothetical protein EJ070_00705 [Mesorhizobium sp. M1E.F.Ca.ET.045.02.1.1]